MFNPAKDSFFCKDTSKVICDDIEWSVKLKNGVYDVKITVGDAEKMSFYGLTVNNQPLFTGEFLKAD